MHDKHIIRIATLMAGAGSAVAAAAPPARPSPEQRAEAAVTKMTLDEKLQLVFGYFATDADWKKTKATPGVLHGSAGIIPGVACPGLPAQWQPAPGVRGRH